MRLTLLALAALVMTLLVPPAAGRRPGFISTTGSFQLSSGGGAGIRGMARGARGGNH